MTLLNIVVQALCAIPANLYGLCLGSRGKSKKSKNKPFTDWLADRLKLIANKDLLTFNDLWSAGLTEPAVDDERVINLEMMTTNLTFGRPYRIPFTDDEPHLFYFRESEFRKLFPKEVVEYLKAAKPHGRRDEQDWPKIGKDYHPFPTGKDLPILVATRMSLSFPILISAVPLYTFDSTLNQIKRCLFSDGGISSNFPIHFFDAPVPTWPTFGITLSSSVVADNRKADESGMVSLCGCNNPRDDEDWNRFDDHWWRLAGFAGAIVTTMEDWRDQTQARVPGYRDRIATIHLRRDEGGLNLKMPSDIVAALSKRGALAGTRLRQRFNPAEGDGSGLNWENQRWIRYRSFMGVFAAMLANFKRNYEFPQPRGVRSYDEMVRNGGIGDTTGHCPPNDKSPFTAVQTSDAHPKTEEFRNLWSAEPSPAETFVEGAPTPPADFVIRPKV